MSNTNINPVFSLKNFRSFGEDGTDFELAPITVLTGCNSAGKSSSVKAQLLLHGLVEKISNRVISMLGDSNRLYNISPRKVLSNLILHVSDKDYQLGRYDKVINDNSTNGIITFSYTIFSELLLSKVTVEMSFIGQEDNVINDAVLHHLSIKTGNTILINMDNLEREQPSSQFTPVNDHINYLSILPFFKTFMVFCIGDQALKEDMAYDLYSSDLTKEEIDKQINITKKWLKEFGLSKRNIDIFRNIKNITNISPSFNNINEFLSKNTLYFWLPIFEQTKGMTKEQVRSWMVEKAKEVSSEKNNQPILWANFFCDDFDASECATLFDYFLLLEKEALSSGEIDSHVSSIPYISTYSVGDSFLLDFGDEIKEDRLNREKPSDRQIFDSNHSFNEILSSLSYIILGPDSVAPTFGMTNSPRSFDVVNSFRSYARAAIFMALNPDFASKIKYVNSSSTIVRRLYVLDENDKIGNTISLFVNGDSQDYIGINRTKESLLFEDEKVKYMPGSFLNKWCEDEKGFNIGKVTIEGTDQGLGAVIYVEKNGKKRLMAEEGYGITQLFTLILQIECCILNATRKQVLTGEWSLYGNSYKVDYEPQVICVEEPEIHLHPKYQSLLAEMFVEAYREYNIRFIIETHSEYLIRKLQVMVADKENALIPDNVSINYVDKDEIGISHNRQIKILEDGRLSEPFGPGFFNEADNLAMEILKYTVRRK